MTNLTAEEAAELEGLFTGALDQGNGTNTFILISGYLVFFMHAGFSMLEAGSVQKKNVVNIMFKNIATITLGGFFYFAFGSAFAYGEPVCGEAKNSFIGVEGFFSTTGGNDCLDEPGWFFQFAFAATAATIVSGAVAGRIALGAYFVVAVLMTGFIYPVVSHWVWGYGFLSESLVDGAGGFIDFAGSGVVHLTGGVAALVGAVACGPRAGRFDGKPLEPSSYTLQTLGTFILWFGWYGFNCGSTLALDGLTASKVAVTTTLSPSAAAVTAIIYSRVVLGRYDLTTTLNSVLAGLVGITAGCAVVTNWGALVIGVVATLVYAGSAKLLEILKIDDPIGASPVHGFAGIWGCIAAALFADEDWVGSDFPRGEQIVQQLIAVICIIAWVGGASALLFFALMGGKPSNRTKFLRVSEEVEAAGIDSSEHGGDFKTHF